MWNLLEKCMVDGFSGQKGQRSKKYLAYEDSETNNVILFFYIYIYIRDKI